MADQLSTGIVLRLVDPEDTSEDLLSSKPILQILSVKKVGGAPGPSNADRYRVIVSDGEHFLQAMLATQLNYMIDDGHFGKNSIVRINQFTCNTVQEKRLLIVMNMEVIVKTTEKIGKPEVAGGASAQQTPAARATTSPAPPAPAPAPSASTSATPAPLRGQGNRAGINHQNVFPIEGLSPYQNNWTIKARVTHKSDIRTWSNQRGEGKLFNVTLMDNSGEIRGTAFNNAVDDLYEKFEIDKVYYISKAKVSLAKKQFNTVANEYELSFERNTEVEECRDVQDLPVIRHNFVQLGGLFDLPKDALCDVIGVVKDAGELTSFTSKFGRPTQKRELTLVDKSEFSVRLTLWGKQAEQYNEPNEPVVAFKGVKVNDFNGRSLSMSASSILSVNPEIPEAYALRGWYDAGGNQSSFQAHSNASGSGRGAGGNFDRAEMKSLAEVTDILSHSTEDLSEKPVYFSTRGTIMHIKQENVAYPACPTCNKKVFEQHDGWRCEKCERSHEKPEYRYIISMAVADYTQQAWFQGFNDVGEIIFHRPANQLMESKFNDEAKFTKTIEEAIGQQFNFTCRVKQETYNDNTKWRYGIQKILPLNYAEEAQHLMQLLQSPWAQ
ncbi:hypothetical protein QCA50_003634 [Cerrena zonata]|uniref:Replication protein A subunit n=1 Tax=Cerrena zonata TaxID=2478898 RepID=A0AAW0GL31_9APHY